MSIAPTTGPQHHGPTALGTTTALAAGGGIGGLSRLAVAVKQDEPLRAVRGPAAATAAIVAGGALGGYLPSASGAGFGTSAAIGATAGGLLAGALAFEHDVTTSGHGLLAAGIAGAVLGGFTGVVTAAVNGTTD